MADYAVVLTTTDSKESAEKIARGLVEQKLAACVNIVPGVESIYHWQDKVETSQEFLLLAKTRESKFDAVRDAVLELHHYEIPEIVLLKISDGSHDYLEWITKNLR
jgi:periplasmic divalent cation tolerance protein